VEVQAVENLASLGFDPNDALEAYLSCDKNEAIAANMLFENYQMLGAGSIDEELPGMDVEQPQAYQSAYGVEPSSLGDMPAPEFAVAQEQPEAPLAD
jgi:hypothetical protein